MILPLPNTKYGYSLHNIKYYLVITEDQLIIDNEKCSEPQFQIMNTKYQIPDIVGNIILTTYVIHCAEHGIYKIMS